MTYLIISQIEHLNKLGKRMTTLVKMTNDFQSSRTSIQVGQNKMTFLVKMDNCVLVKRDILRYLINQYNQARQYPRLNYIPIYLPTSYYPPPTSHLLSYMATYLPTSYFPPTILHPYLPTYLPIYPPTSYFPPNILHTYLPTSYFPPTIRKPYLPTHLFIFLPVYLPDIMQPTY